MAIHISEFNIHKFRGITDLRLENLKDINILTGDNNTGKTSVLEVLNYLSAPDDLRTLIYGSKRILWPLFRDNLVEYDRIKFLFPIDDDGVISYSFKHDNETTEISIQKKEFVKSLTLEEYKKADPRSYGYINDELLFDTTKDVDMMKLEFFENGKIVKNVEFYEISRTEFDQEAHLSYGKTLYISPFRHVENTNYLASIFEDTSLYEEMLQILKEFDEGILSINVDVNGHTTKVYKILSKEHNRAIPLNYYGDGMKKAILLMSAVVNAKDGILLLDEFETAIHTSAMDKVFSWIIKICMKLNVQLFLTTHSDEAIQKILKVSPDLQNHINLYTLYKKNGKTSVRSLSCEEALKIREEFGLELR